MPIISMFFGIIIRMYFNDAEQHHTPHFHAKYGEFETSFDLVYDFKPNLNHKFYRPLADTKLFGNVSVVDGQIEWVTGQDFCPHTLYEQSVPIAETDLTDEEKEIIRQGLDEHARGGYVPLVEE